MYVGGSQDVTRVYCGGRCASLGIIRVELHHHLPSEQRPHADPVLPPTPPNSHDVKLWAVRQGLIPGVQRGRCPQRLVDAYVAAHMQASA